MAAQLVVEIEVLTAVFDGVDKVNGTLAYRLINPENGDAVLATKEVPFVLEQMDDIKETAELFRKMADDAVHWGQWLVAANKASALVGKKRRLDI